VFNLCENNINVLNGSMSDLFDMVSVSGVATPLGPASPLFSHPAPLICIKYIAFLPSSSQGARLPIPLALACTIGGARWLSSLIGHRSAGWRHLIGSSHQWGAAPHLSVAIAFQKYCSAQRQRNGVECPSEQCTEFPLRTSPSLRVLALGFLFFFFFRWFDYFY